jgi:hypothetical protein
LVGFTAAYVPTLFVLTTPRRIVEPEVLAAEVQVEGEEADFASDVEISSIDYHLPMPILGPFEDEIATPVPMQDSIVPTESGLQNDIIKTSEPAPTLTPEPTQDSTPEAHEVSQLQNDPPSPLASEGQAPRPTPDVWSPAELEPIFAQYAGQYGVDKNLLERIANCESHFNPNASGNGGAYLGMFQFSASTWINNRNLMGMDPSPELRTNAEESIRTAAFLMSRAGDAPWPACIAGR